MAIYHLSVKPISRKGGRSATAAAAYRSAELVYDETTGESFDYTRRRGVEHTEIVLPTEAARRDINWARDRQQLWNEAERAENRSNSRVAREYELALPHEMTHGQRVELVHAFSQQLADRFGVAVDAAIHAPHWHGDDRNYHAHLLTTTRVIEPDGLGEKSAIEWSDGNRRKAGLEPAKVEIKQIRAQWEELANERLQSLGLEARIDHRSLKDQGLEREPTVHLGPAVSGLERRGIESEVGKRLELEAREAAQARLERAAELGRLERESQLVQRSILDLSGDLAGAKRERDLELAKARTLTQKPKTIAEIQREGREQWAAHRAEQKAKEQAQALERGGPDRGVDLTPDRKPALSIEEQQAEGRRRWAEYREQQALGKNGPAPEAEKKGPEKGRGLERDGPEIE